MNLFGWLKRSKTIASGDPALIEFFGGERNSYGIPVSPDSAMRVAAVYACVRVLAEAVASVPLFLYRRTGDDKEKATDHPLYRVLHDRPNPYQTSFDFRDQLQTSLGLRGAAYCEIVVTPRGKVQLIPLHPDTVEPKLMDDFTVAYRVWEKGVSRILLQDEVLRLTYMVKDGVTPLSPVRAQRDAIAGAIASQEYTAGFFRNGGRPPGWLEHPSHFRDDEQRRAFRAKFASQFTGDNIGQTPLLEQGVKYNAVAVSNEDAQLLEMRKFSIAEIARIYRVPLVLLSETEKSTSWGTGIEQFMLSYVTHTLRPWFVRWEQALSRDLLTEDEQEEYFFEFNIDALLRADLLTRYRAYEIGRRGGWLSANDVRARENMNKIEDGDKYGDVNVNAPKEPADPKADDPKADEDSKDE